MTKIRGFEKVESKFMKGYESQEEIMMPLRATQKSSGYDFYAPYATILYPGDSHLFWSDVKAYMQDDEELLLTPRSSIGIKKNIMLANTEGKIDADYYSNPDNDGNIGICLRNYGDQKVVIEKGERIVQGTFRKYLVADNCNSNQERVGGIGHTGVK